MGALECALFLNAPTSLVASLASAVAALLSDCASASRVRERFAVPADDGSSAPPLARSLSLHDGTSTRLGEDGLRAALAQIADTVTLAMT